MNCRGTIWSRVGHILTPWCSQVQTLCGSSGIAILSCHLCGFLSIPAKAGSFPPSADTCGTLATLSTTVRPRTVPETAEMGCLPLWALQDLQQIIWQLFVEVVCDDYWEVGRYSLGDRNHQEMKRKGGLPWASERWMIKETWVWAWRMRWKILYAESIACVKVLRQGKVGNGGRNNGRWRREVREWGWSLEV